MINITKISSKGQVVIPKNIREKLKVEEGNLFIVTGQDELICLRKMEMPKIKTWKEATKPFRKAAQKSGFNKDDLDRIIQEVKINKK